MKVAYGSDFHFEFYSEKRMYQIMKNWGFDHDTELIIIAGDLHVGAEKVIQCLEFIWKSYDIPIVYVPGNHEYYDSSFEAENNKFMEHGLVQKGYTILLNGCCIFGGVMFAGCMGNLDGSWELINCGIHGSLNDFHMISDFKDRVIRGETERTTLIHNLEYNRGDKTVVITHTMPSPKCISGKYKGSYLNPCFANDWEREMVDYKPEYWICGHTHDVSTMKLHNTDILINPMGYPHESKKWDWRYFNV